MAERRKARFMRRGEIYCLLLAGAGSSERDGSCTAAGGVWGDADHPA